MTYVPDATVYTIEVIKENGLMRMVQNFRRWSGNMLRNGSRAIALGPTAMPFFIWWCIVDQRIAMWTMIVSPVMAILGSMIVPGYYWNCIIWVLFSRIVLCLFLFGYSRRADMTWPFILYLNQVVNASVKIYMVFHLSKQKWSNRGNQSAGDGSGMIEMLKNGIAMFQLVTTVAAFLMLIMMYVGLIETPIR
jgi:glycosyltransferase Alg8